MVRHLVDLQHPNDMVIPGNGNDPNLWLQVHDYDPFCFTTPQCGSPVITTWGTANEQQAIRDNFNNLINWARTRAPRTPIMMGEFACSTLQPCNTCRALWYSTYVAAMKLHDQFNGWALWDDNGWFKTYDRGTHTWDADVLRSIGM